MRTAGSSTASTPWSPGTWPKFGQHPQLRDFLASTGSRVLVEASPLDRIWGTELAADHDQATPPERCPGLNLVGFPLMEVRHQLRAQQAV
jgi:ribA/ribD-fused uncharacterized protein